MQNSVQKVLKQKQLLKEKLDQGGCLGQRWNLEKLDILFEGVTPSKLNRDIYLAIIDYFVVDKIGRDRIEKEAIVTGWLTKTIVKRLNAIFKSKTEGTKVKQVLRLINMEAKKYLDGIMLIRAEQDKNHINHQSVKTILNYINV